MRLEYKIGVVVAVAVVGLGTWFFVTRDRAADTNAARGPEVAKTDATKPTGVAKQASPQPTQTPNRPTMSPTPKPVVRSEPTMPKPTAMPTAVTTRPSPSAAPGFSINPDRSASPGIRSETPMAKPELPLDRPTAFAERPAPPVAKPVTPPTDISGTSIASATPVRAAPSALPPNPTAIGTPPPISTPAPASPTGATTTKTHVMKQGDTIQGLAVKYYGAAKYAPLILNANKQFGDPKKIPIGAKITIPPAPPAETPKAGVASGTPTTRPSTEARAASGEPRRQPPNTKPYVVKKGENWRRIAADVMGDGSKWTELFEMNKRSPNESPQTLHAGETIYVPTTAAAGTPPTRTLMSTTPKP